MHAKAHMPQSKSACHGAAVCSMHVHDHNSHALQGAPAVNSCAPNKAQLAQQLKVGRKQGVGERRATQSFINKRQPITCLELRTLSLKSAAHHYIAQ